MNISKKLTAVAAMAAAVASFGLAHLSTAHAEETTTEKMESAMDEAKKDVKKNARKAKRKFRDHSGHGSLSKDAGDAAKDAGDAISTEAKEMKRKAD